MTSPKLYQYLHPILIHDIYYHINAIHLSWGKVNKMDLFSVYAICTKGKMFAMRPFQVLDTWHLDETLYMQVL